MNFSKMKVMENEYIIINCFKEVVDNHEELSINLCDKLSGIGADGAIFLYKSDCADFRVRIFNPNGSEAEMSCNGLSCVGKYVFEKNLIEREFIKIELPAGIRVITLCVDNNTVTSVNINLCEPILTPQCIPVDYMGEEFIDKCISVDCVEFAITCLSLGNPHAVTYVDDLESTDVGEFGPLIEIHQIFPNYTNVEFVKVIDRNNLQIKLWERGAGETKSSGTGACAALVASVINNLTDRKANVIMPGGCVEIEWNENDDCVYMSSSSEFVEEGNWQ